MSCIHQPTFFWALAIPLYTQAHLVKASISSYEAGKRSMKSLEDSNQLCRGAGPPMNSLGLLLRGLKPAFEPELGPNIFSFVIMDFFALRAHCPKRQTPFLKKRGKRSEKRMHGKKEERGKRKKNQFINHGEIFFPSQKTTRE